MMSFGKFTDEVRQEVERKMPDKKVRTHVVEKNNGVSRTGIIIIGKGKASEKELCPTIYLDNYYSMYNCRMADIKEIVRMIIDVYERNSTPVFGADILNSYESSRSRIRSRLVNLEMNRKLLNKVPHKVWGDLAVVYYVCLQAGSTSASTVISNSLMDYWKIGIDELIRADEENSEQSLDEVYFKSMYEIFTNNHICERDYIPTDMYVLSNKTQSYGAGLLRNKTILSQIADKIDNDLIIIPSSVHELIVMPYVSCFEVSELEKMIREVNSEINTEDILSSHVYGYNRKKNDVIIGKATD